MEQLLQSVTQMVKYLNGNDHDPKNHEQVGIMQSTLGILFCQVESLAWAEKLVKEHSTDPNAQKLMSVAEESSLRLLKGAASLFSSTAQITSPNSH